ncbi:MAG: carboxylesterase/lipase family protein [Acidimicrobiales bacterium]
MDSINGRKDMSHEDTIVVETPWGAVKGYWKEGVAAFKGIPFAATPVGESRFSPPMTLDPWPGVLDAADFGHIAPQPDPIPAMSIAGDPVDWNEDCLSLNIWTPGVDGAKRPVMVWIHGGGFATGSSGQVLYRGERLAGSGDVVVVTINYRLGSLGFLAHPTLRSTWPADRAGRHYYGNWGLMDQIAALRFVKDVVAGFGGDPSNVTIFGESAGGMSVAALLVCEEARGLFHKAIIESGPPSSISLDLAANRAMRIGKMLGVDTPRAFRERLGDIQADEIIKADQQLGLEVIGEGAMPLAFLPVVDGGLLRAPLADLIASGETARVPLLIGTNRDETALFSAGEILGGGLEEGIVLHRMSKILGDDAAGAVVGKYREIRAARGEGISPVEIWIAASTDYVFRLPSIEVASAHMLNGSPAYVYLFDWETSFMGASLGSCHALEVPFVFGSVAEQSVQPFTGSGPEAEELSAAMQQAWVAFALSGDPSCEEVGEWPAYGADSPTMILGRERRVDYDPRGRERQVWEGAGLHPFAGHHK